MPDKTQPADARALLQFREQLELGDGLFREITGIDASTLFAYRRGKLKERPKISSSALARVERCKVAHEIAMELTRDEEKALDWLHAESPAWGGKSPVDLTVSDSGLGLLQSYIEKLRAAVGAATSAPKPAAPVPEPARVPVAPPPPVVAIKAPVEGKSPPRAAETSATPPKEAPQSRAEEFKVEVSNPGAPSEAPPAGVSPGERVFRLKDPLAKIRAARPELTLKLIGAQMAERGFSQYEKSSYVSRVSNSYAWATWAEVVAMAEVLGVSPQGLGSVRTKG